MLLEIVEDVGDKERIGGSEIIDGGFVRPSIDMVGASILGDECCRMGLRWTSDGGDAGGMLGERSRYLT